MQKLPKTFLVAALFLGLGARAWAGPTLTAAEFGEQLLRIRSQHAAPSVVVATLYRGQAPRYFCLGDADVLQGVSATPDTSYMLFSMTKLFTAVAVLQLAEQGKFRLSQPVAELLPDFNYRNPWGNPVTVEELLSHTSGVPKPSLLTLYRAIHLTTEAAPSLRKLLWSWAQPGRFLRSQPGEKFEYSNVGYVWLGLLIEKASGMPYQDYVSSHILQPLCMDATGFAYPDISKAARGYARSGSFSGILGRLMSQSKFHAPSPPGLNAIQYFYVDAAPMGGLVGPLSDMTRFAAACLNQGELDGAQILKPQSLASMFVAAKNRKGRFLEAGLCWWLEDVDGEWTAFQQGTGGGFRSEIRLYPKLGYAVMVAANQTGFDTSAVCRMVLEDKSGR